MSMPVPIKVGSIVRLPNVAKDSEQDFLEGVVGAVDFDGVATITVIFPTIAARTVTLDQVVPVGAETPTPLRTFVAAILSACASSSSSSVRPRY
eukprot:SAG31_NODE_4932_length_2854_cov_5.855898_3_plen_94_part_00